MPRLNEEDVWFVYDGECPLCRTGARNFNVNDMEGQLHKIDKRTQDAHPVVEEIRQKRLNLDKGMVLKYRGRLYQGAEALGMMSRISAGNGWVTRIGKTLFAIALFVICAIPSCAWLEALLSR